MAEFGKRVGDILSSTFVGFALSLSKEVGILSVLIEAEQPLTSHQIADTKELKERYAREILNCLATAEVIHVSKNDAGALVYHLTPEEKQAFKSPLIAFASFPGIMTTLYDKVKRCLPKTGPNGIRYSEEVHNCIQEFSDYQIDRNVEKILQHVEGLKEQLESGIEVIEFGCGRGGLLAKFAQLFPKSTFIASEVTPALLEQLKVNLGHIPNIKYEIFDVCSLPNPPVKQYDWIYSVDVIHDLPNPPEALKGIRRHIKEANGVYTMIDMATTGSPIEDRGSLNVAFHYAESTFLCIPESYQQEDSHALGACWGKQTAINLATDAGFNVQAKELETNVAVFVCKPQIA